MIWPRSRTRKPSPPATTAHLIGRLDRLAKRRSPRQRPPRRGRAAVAQPRRAEWRRAGDRGGRPGRALETSWRRRCRGARAASARAGRDAPCSEAAPGAAATPPARRRSQGIPRSPAQSIRVNVDLLENLMTMVSELVLTRNQLLQILRSQKDSEFTAPLQRLVACHDRAAGRRHEDAHAADRQCLGQAAAHRPRPLARARQEDRAAACSAPRPSSTARCSR